MKRNVLFNTLLLAVVLIGVVAQAADPDPALRFKQDKRPHVAFVVSDDHYHADKTLPVFAQMLRRRYGCHCTVLHGQGKADIPGLDELETADAMVLFIRRLALPKEQLEKIRAYLDAGKPLVALRTANHAFAVNGKLPEGRAQWQTFDPEVLGSNYHGHGPNKLGTDVATVPEAADHPILAGVRPGKWHSTGSLYFVAPVDKAATVLMTGSAQGRTEPLTWIRNYKGGRVFYTGLGHPDDFKQPQFRRLLINAIFWAMDRPVPEVDKAQKADYDDVKLRTCPRTTSQFWCEENSPAREGGVESAENDGTPLSRAGLWPNARMGSCSWTTP